MNNTIAWILTTFVIVTIILDLSTFILMKTNNKAYEQNGNKPRKGKAYWMYLVVSRLALAMTVVATTLIGCFVFTKLGDLMAHHKNIATYVIAACVWLILASITWCATQRNIKESLDLKEYNPNQDDELEPFIDPKDLITINHIGLWLITNIITGSFVIIFASFITHLWL